MTLGLTIRKRVIITAVFLFFAGTVSMGVLIYRHTMDDLLEDLKEFPAHQSKLFDSILNADAEGLARAQAGFARVDSLLRPFAARRRRVLFATALPIFKEIRENNNITHMYFIDPDGSVYLRVHKPLESGDRLGRATFLKARRTSRIATGLEMGKNFFSLRSVQRVSYRGKPIGYLEVAEEIDHVFGQMKRINSDDVSLFLTEDFLRSQSTHVTGGRGALFETAGPGLRLSLRLQRGDTPRRDLLQGAVSQCGRHFGGAGRVYPRYLRAETGVPDADGIGTEVPDPF